MMIFYTLTYVFIMILISNVFKGLRKVHFRKETWLEMVSVFLTDKFGQRAFVGKICMDLNDIVPEYKETTEESDRKSVV